MSVPRRDHSLIGRLQKGRALRAFSMLEVLFALMILGVGLIAVASIFPVAATLQRETIDDIYIQQVGESVKAKVLGRGFRRRQLDQGGEDTVYVQPVPPEVLSGSANVNDINWLLADRSYPAVADAFEDPDHLARHYYWVPLMQRRGDDTWRIHIFLLRNARTEDYPASDDLANPDDGWIDGEGVHAVPVVRRREDVEVAGSARLRFTAEEPPDFLDIGTQFLDNYGVIHTVVLTSGDEVTLASPIQAGREPQAIWYGVPSTSGRIPTRKIMTFGSEALR